MVRAVSVLLVSTLFAAASLAPVLLAPTRAAAQLSPAPDVVRLRDGTVLRGTIAERSPTRVVIVLATGETRTYSADEVEAAGPDVSAGTPIVQQSPTIVMPLPASPPTARLHVRSSVPGLALVQLDATAFMPVFVGRRGVARFEQFSLVCNAPCDVGVPEGTYQLGVSRGTEDPQRVGAPLDLRGDVTLELGYEDRSGFRIAGWTTLGIGLAAAVGMIIPAIFISGYGNDGARIGLFISGGAVAAASVSIGLALGLMFDIRSIDVVDGVRF